MIGFTFRIGRRWTSLPTYQRGTLLSVTSLRVPSGVKSSSLARTRLEPLFIGCMPWFSKLRVRMHVANLPVHNLHPIMLIKSKAIDVAVSRILKMTSISQKRHQRSSISAVIWGELRWARKTMTIQAVVKQLTRLSNPNPSNNRSKSVYSNQKTASSNKHRYPNNLVAKVRPTSPILRGALAFTRHNLLSHASNTALQSEESATFNRLQIQPRCRITTNTWLRAW